MSLWHSIGLIVLLLLVWFLHRRHEARVCKRVENRARPGRGMDVTPVSNRIQQVREDYLVVVSARPHDGGRKQRLHAVARRTLRRLAYFGGAGPEASDSPHDEARAHSG